MEPPGEPASQASRQKHKGSRANPGGRSPGLATARAAGDKLDPGGPLTHPQKAPPTQQRGPWPPCPTCPWPPCRAAPLSQVLGLSTPGICYSTRLALLAALTTNMLSDKVGRKKVLELETMSEIIPYPHREGEGGACEQVTQPAPGEGFCPALSLFSFLFYFPT